MNLADSTPTSGEIDGGDLKVAALAELTAAFGYWPSLASS
jgi:hypothetical protein